MSWMDLHQLKRKHNLPTRKFRDYSHYNFRRFATQLHSRDIAVIAYRLYINIAMHDAQHDNIIAKTLI